MEKKKEKKCACKHEVGHPCNFSGCWCPKHWIDTNSPTLLARENKCKQKEKCGHDTVVSTINFEVCKKCLKAKPHDCGEGCPHKDHTYDCPCSECNFEQGHSLECSKYVKSENPMATPENKEERCCIRCVGANASGICEKLKDCPCHFPSLPEDIDKILDTIHCDICCELSDYRESGPHSCGGSAIKQFFAEKLGETNSGYKYIQGITEGLRRCDKFERNRIIEILEGMKEDDPYDHGMGEGQGWIEAMREAIKKIKES